MIMQQTATFSSAAEFPRIEDYGVIGNLHTVALVANTGAIEFFAYPHFDSPTLFTATLDRSVGGAFTLTADGVRHASQRYEEATNVLVTRLETHSGILEITDFMPVGRAAATNQLVRCARCVSGTVAVSSTCRPVFDDGRVTAHAVNEDPCRVGFNGKDVGFPVRLVASQPLEAGDGAATLFTRLEAGDHVTLNLVCENAQSDLLSDDHVEEALADTLAFWREWIGGCRYDGPWCDHVHRSALVLKLLFAKAHGSIVAAPTYGLPEVIGGARNWDYRYCWLRDSAFTIYAMLRLGFTDEAAGYRDWINARLAERSDGYLNLLYRVDGSVDGLEERTLDHLSGYKDSRPVRVGNAAFHQTQLDIYGEVIDSLYLSAKHLEAINEDSYAAIGDIATYVCKNWQNTGSGMWEMRGPPRQFIDARLFCWVALDRAIRLAGKLGRGVPENWPRHREQIAHSIHTHFWNDEIGAFTQTPDAKVMDAVVLLMPMVKFISPVDERFRSTVRRVEKTLVDGCFVRRYADVPAGQEGLDGPPEGAFTTCSFWYIEVLARSGRVDEASALMDDILAHASPLGLFAEELASNGIHLGNTPQALPHLALISAATAIVRAQESGGEPF